MKRYLLFDSGCGVCSSIATSIQQEADGWLEVRALRNPDTRALLDSKVPGWRWEPMLIELIDEQPRVFTGIGMGVRLLTGLGFRRTLNIVRLINQNPQFNPERRATLKASSLLLIGAVLLRLPKSWTIMYPKNRTTG